MLPGHRIPTHPGVILRPEFLAPLGVSQVTVARHIGVPVQGISQIVRGKRGITRQTAWLFLQALSTTPEFWTNLQATYDLAGSRPAERVQRLAALTPWAGLKKDLAV